MHLLSSYISKKTLPIKVILSLSVLITVSFVSIILSLGYTQIVILIGILSLLSILLTIEVKQYILRDSSLVIPSLLVLLPFQRVLIQNSDVVTALQIGTWFIVLVHLLFSSEKNRKFYLVKFRILLLPTAIFVVVFVLAYLIGGEIEGKHWKKLIDTISSISFAYLACIYIKDFSSFKWTSKLIIACGIFQLPFLLAQTKGILDFIPILNSERWGGPVNSLTPVIRFGGTFGDAELLAEYLGILSVLCLCNYVFVAKKFHGIRHLIAAGILFFAAFYTGTRGFLVSMAVSILSMAFIAMFFTMNSQRRVKLGLLIVAVALGVMGLFSLPQFQGYLERFLHFKVEVFEENFLNRGIIFNTIISLSKDSPWVGYGAHATEVLSNAVGTELKSAHSLYLGLLLIGGVPGALLSISLVLWPMYLSFKLARSATYYRYLGMSFLAVLIYWSFNELKIDFLRYPHYMNFIQFFFGMIVSAYVNDRSTYLNIKKSGM